MIRTVTVTIMIIIFLMIFTGMEAIYAQTFELLDNFEGGEQMRMGSIYFYTDKKDGGDSTINELRMDREAILQMDPNSTLEQMIVLQFQFGAGAKDSNGFAKISGTVTTTYEKGYVGCGFDFSDDSRDLTTYQGIKFYTKGSERAFVVKLISDIITDNAYPEAVFTPSQSDWTAVSIDFEQFQQSPTTEKEIPIEAVLKALKGFQWQTQGQPIEKYELYLDNIELVK
jgi:hypothetical protein